MRLNVVGALVDFADHAAAVLRIAAALDIAVIAAESDVGVDNKGVRGGECDAEQDCGEGCGGFHCCAFRLVGEICFQAAFG